MENNIDSARRAPSAENFDRNLPLLGVIYRNPPQFASFRQPIPPTCLGRHKPFPSPAENVKELSAMP
jgi:hypothetical protein